MLETHDFHTVHVEKTEEGLGLDIDPVARKGYMVVDGVKDARCGKLTLVGCLANIT